MNKPVIIGSLISGLLVLYYCFKPAVPRRVRYVLRRILARRALARSTDWPIKPGTEAPPINWPGWPGGKKFAFVLTHDVEETAGLAVSRDLMELEASLGFRSAFYFVPEGDYRVPVELREELGRRGFEVGVHDLYHNGTLFRSHKEFQTQSARINQYLAEWGAVGFRSGFMFHDLRWLRRLNARYDASTFDVDPFEPQPGGVHTLFPFWVAGTDEFEGYVELPYTLVQDSTLFLLLRERSINIWKRKLDWIAEHGGMVLLNTHPDYMAFNGRAPRWAQYPAGLYQELLEYVRQKHEGTYWQALPREVADYCMTFKPALPPLVTDSPSGKVLKAAESVPAQAERKTVAGCVLMFVENNYPDDTRVRNEAEALTEAGYSVTVVAYRRKNQVWREMVRGVQVYRMPRMELFAKTPVENPTFFQRVSLKFKSVAGYVSEYIYFTGACFTMSAYVAFKHGFDVIHAHNPPDTLFLVALPWRLLGRKFIYDHHDLCPELYRSRYGARHDVVAGVLQFVEWCNLKLANVTIATNESYKEVQIRRGGRRPESIFVVRNGPNRKRMEMPAPSRRLRGMNKNILVYIGSLNPQDGLDYLIRALKHLRYDLKREDFYCVIMGNGDSLEDLRGMVKRFRLEGHVELTGFVSDAELQENLAAADICMDPDPSSPLNDVSTWIKIMEYMAYGKPIVSFDLKETRFSAQEAALYVPANDELAFAQATVRLMDDRALREQMGRFGRDRVEKELQWSVVSRNLVAAYESLGLRKAEQA